MAVNICTTDGKCFRCDRTLEGTLRLIKANKAKDEPFFCCGSTCVAIDKITSITEVAREPDDDDDDRGGGLDLGHPDIVIVTGGYQSRRRPRATPLRPAEPWTLDEETGDRRSEGE